MKKALLDLKVPHLCQKLSLQNLSKKLQTVALNSSEIYIVNVQLDNSTVKLTLGHIVDLISGWFQETRGKSFESLILLCQLIFPQLS